MQVDDPIVPTILTELIESTGAMPIPHHEYLQCCGKACRDYELTLGMSADVFQSILNSQEDCLGLICPTCFDSLDVGQIRVSRQVQKDFQIPVVYYFQLLAIAQGATPAEVGINHNKIMPKKFLEKLQGIEIP